MVERIEDLNLPMANVARLMKDALPPQVSVTKEARSALTRAASVFILYLTTTASGNASNKKLKTLQAQHIFEALEEIEFEHFVGPLKEFLEQYRASQKEKRESKGTTSKQPAAKQNGTPKGTPKKGEKNDGDESDVEIVTEEGK